MYEILKNCNIIENNIKYKSVILPYERYFLGKVTLIDEVILWVNQENLQSSDFCLVDNQICQSDINQPSDKDTFKIKYQSYDYLKGVPILDENKILDYIVSTEVLHRDKNNWLSGFNFFKNTIYNSQLNVYIENFKIQKIYYEIK